MKFGQNKKPRVKHLQIFGCGAFAHIPKDERSKKIYFSLVWSRNQRLSAL